MGLDMYLYRKTYIWNDKETKLSIKVGKDAPKYARDEVEKINPSKVKYIVEEVGYWRKANAIHQWFVNNVQGGEDDCGNYYVDESQLKELRDVCQRVLNESKLVKGKVVNGYTYENGKSVPNYEDGEYIEDSKVAEELLPTQSGFFFGGTEYDQWYIRDLEETIKIIDEALKIGGEFEYHSSW